MRCSSASPPGGDVAWYVGRYGKKRIGGVVLISAVPPLMLKTESNPGGSPLMAFDQTRAVVLTDRAQFFKDLSIPFYGANRPGSQVSQGLQDAFWMQCMQAGLNAIYDGVKASSETDLTEDLGKFDVPTSSFTVKMTRWCRSEPQPSERSNSSRARN